MRNAGIAMVVLGGLMALGGPIGGYAALRTMQGGGCNWTEGDPILVLGCVGALSVGFVLAAAATLAGLAIEGVGVKLYATGNARNVLQDRIAVGHAAAFWVGWVLSGVAAIGMLTGVAENIPALEVTGMAADVGTTLAFGVGMATTSSNLPHPSLSAVREPSGAMTPTFGLAMQF